MNDNKPAEIVAPVGMAADQTRGAARPWLFWVALVLTGLGAGVAAWLGGETQLERFRPDESVSSQRFAFAALDLQLKTAATRNAALACGLLGATLGLGLGIAGGLVRGSIVAALGAGLVGLALGGSLGVGGSFGFMPIYWRYKDPSGTDLGQALLIHSALWSSLGLAGGLAYGLGRFGLRSRPLFLAAVGGLAGALVGTVAFEIIGAVGFPFARTAQPIAATATTRLLGRLAVALGTALGIGLALRDVGRRDGPVAKREAKADLVTP